MQLISYPAFLRETFLLSNLSLTLMTQIQNNSLKIREFIVDPLEYKTRVTLRPMRKLKKILQKKRVCHYLTTFGEASATGGMNRLPVWLMCYHDLNYMT